eukprot:SAG11_NODE_8062_length_1064_cov_0.564767_2_plen_194_part_00
MPTVKDLQAELKLRGLDTKGKKAELEKRLAEANAVSAVASPTATATSPSRPQPLSLAVDEDALDRTASTECANPESYDSDLRETTVREATDFGVFVDDEPVGAGPPQQTPDQEPVALDIGPAASPSPTLIDDGNIVQTPTLSKNGRSSCAPTTNTSTRRSRPAVARHGAREERSLRFNCRECSMRSTTIRTAI